MFVPLSLCFRYKWDLIKSVLKSAAGWQQGKLKELQIPTYGTGPAAGEQLEGMELRSSAGGLGAVRWLWRGSKGGAKGGAPSAVLKELEVGSAESSSGGVVGLEGMEDEGSGGGGLPGGREGMGRVGGLPSRVGTEVKEILREAWRQKQKQEKVTKLLGPVPAFKKKVMAAVGGAGVRGTGGSGSNVPPVAAAAAGGGSPAATRKAGDGGKLEEQDLE